MISPIGSQNTSHYDKDYFAWQKKSGIASGMLDCWKFEKYTDETKEVLDLGCGGGYILDKLKASKKFGVEINLFARVEAAKKGITVFENIRSIPAELLFDVIISHHALEHVLDPFNILVELEGHLKKNGTIILFLPFNDWRKEKKYKSGDINSHLFTWSPLNIGNLLSAAGYKNIEASIVRRPVLDSTIPKSYIPDPLYNLFSLIWSVATGTVEVKAMASRNS